MNKKGFTLVELIAVIVVIGLLATITFASVTRYRKQFNEKEVKALRQSMVGSFQNYRVYHTVLKNIEVDVNNLEFDQSLSYNEKRCNPAVGSVKYVVRGEKDTTDPDSLEEIFCVQFTCNGELLIDDRTTNPTYCSN